MRPDEVECRDVVEMLTEYLDGALAPGDRVELEQHLLFCEPCMLFLEQMRSSIVLTGRIEEDEVPEAVLDQMVRMFRERDGR